MINSSELIADNKKVRLYSLLLLLKSKGSSNSII